MEKLMKELHEWLAERPRWLQVTASRLIQDGTMPAVNELVRMCKAEACLDSKKADSMLASPLSSHVKRSRASLRLVSISDVRGINALSPRKPLCFGDEPLTIIWGQNGSGKSGYVRILKHACGARAAGSLLRNVFTDDSGQQRCTITITLDDELRSIDWTLQNGVQDELRSVQIYDSDCASVYVNEENQVTHEPWALSLLGVLVQACEQVGQALREEIARKPSKKPMLPEMYQETCAGKWYSSISSSTAEIELDQWCRWSEDLEAEASSLKKRLAEPEPAEKAKAAMKAVTATQSLWGRLRESRQILSDEHCSAYFIAKKDALGTRTAADVDVRKIFEEVPLSGVGSESWRLLWNAARQYSEKHAYPGETFPYIDANARCVLCHQLLSETSRKLSISFEEYVKGELERKAQLAEKKVEELEAEFSKLLPKEAIETSLDLAGVTDDETRIQVADFMSRLHCRREALTTENDINRLPALPATDVIIFLEEWAKRQSEEAAGYEEAAEADNREELKRRLEELEAHHWVASQKKAIVADVARHKEVHNLTEAVALANTQALLRKKSQLAEELLTREYAQRFTSELERLRASEIKAKLVKTRTTKGQVYHKVKLAGCSDEVSASEILSEGEQRIVSLAGFLADVETQENEAPFVFDDPISSLDQYYEEATVRRIVELTSSRQVIVFTHRLSMVALIEQEAKRQSVPYEAICLQRYGSGTGDPVGQPIFVKAPDKALNSLINERLSRARKTYDASGREEYDALAKSICRDCRILLERFIETVLLNGIVKRFRRSIMTKKKLKRLASITIDDCELFDDLMTKYSRYEHSQPCETPVMLPLPEELEKDMTELANWYKCFKARGESPRRQAL